VCGAGSEKAPRIKDFEEVNMCKAQQVTGPVAAGQYGALGVRGPSPYYPMQTSIPTAEMFSAMMPMIMMLMMMAIITPMVKGVTDSSKP
jgi:hypothetical protein